MKELLEHIGKLSFGGLTLEIYEGCGGHVKGETVIVCDEYRIIFTGDIFVNAKGFSEKQKQFNLLAPYLMTSVNADSEKAKKLREYISEKYIKYTLFPGHGTEIMLT